MGFGGLILNNWRSPKLYRVTETEKAVPSMSGNILTVYFTTLVTSSYCCFQDKDAFKGLDFNLEFWKHHHLTYNHRKNTLPSIFPRSPHWRVITEEKILITFVFDLEFLEMINHQITGMVMVWKSANTENLKEEN